MNKKSVLDKFEAIATNIISNNEEGKNLEIYDIEYVKEGPNNILRIYIDKKGGILVSDCEFLNRKLIDVLEENDPIQENYILEVSSAGVERVLKKEKHFLGAIGKVVNIKTFKPINKTKDFTGELISFENNILTIKNEQTEQSFDFKDVAKCNVVAFF